MSVQGQGDLRVFRYAAGLRLVQDVRNGDIWVPGIEASIDIASYLECDKDDRALAIVTRTPERGTWKKKQGGAS